MPMQATSAVLHDGPRNLIMQFTGICDGSGDETLVKKVDVAALSPVPLTVKIKETQYEVNGGILKMFWEADDPVLIDSLASVGERCYEEIGGMPNGGGPTATGNILFSTIGFDSGSSYSVVLEMVKKF